MMQDGRLSAGHARALISTGDPVGLAHKIVAGGLSVRAAEELAQSAKNPALRAGGGKASAATKPRDPDTLGLERELAAQLGLKVTIDFDGKKGGRLTIHYATLDQLDDVLHRLNKTPRTVN